MAGSVKCFMKLNLGLLSKNLSRHIALNQTRTLFSEQSLGMTGYQMARNSYKHQFLNLEDSFRSRMKSYVENEATGMIFTEDLKVMLHLAEKTPEDKELLVKMVNKFNGQSDDTRFTTFTFGPIVMRSFLRLNEPELALEMFNDPSFSMFFSQLSSYQILLDLLYRNKQYKDMMEVYNTIRGKLTDGKVHPRNALILVSAACYKENTPESMKYALDLWRDLDKRGYPMIRRVLTHLAALSINQGQPHVALEILMPARKPRYIALRCLKIMAFCDIDRLEDIVPFFRMTLEHDDPAIKKETYFKDTIDRVEAAIERNKFGPDSEIVKLLKLIKTGKYIQENTLDDHINEEIVVVPRTYQTMRDESFSRGNMETSDSQNSRPRIVRRPGLRELI